MRRLLAVALVVASLAAPGQAAAARWERAATSAPAPAAVQPVMNAVTWSVDEDAKTITATVRLTLGTRCTSEGRLKQVLRGPRFARRCTVDDDVVRTIKQNVEAIWNRGYTYKCYRLIVLVDVKVDEVPVDQHTGDTRDRAFITIDRSPAGIRSFVTSAKYPGARWNGNTPNDRNYPTNGDDPPSTWRYPPGRDYPSLYAHELGHVLGLDDHYEDVKNAKGKVIGFRIKRGAPDDVMSDPNKTTLDQSTIDRLVERSDAFKGGKPTCDYRVNTRVDWYVFTGTKCGGAQGEWEISVDGKRDLGGGRLILNGTIRATLARKADLFTGKWNGRYGIIADVPGQATGGQNGTISGPATLDKKVLHLKGVKAKGSFWAQAPHFSRSGSADPLKDLTLPVENGSFCH